MFLNSNFIELFLISFFIGWKASKENLERRKVEEMGI
jgi:hypothetical protein